MAVVTFRAALRALGWTISELMPARAIRNAAGRDYEAALKRATPTNPTPADTAAAAGDCPAGKSDESAPLSAPPAGRPDSTDGWRPLVPGIDLFLGPRQRGPEVVGAEGFTDSERQQQ